MRRARVRHLREQNAYLHEIIGLVADGKADLYRDPQWPDHIYVTRQPAFPGATRVYAAPEIIYPPKVDRA